MDELIHLAIVERAILALAVVLPVAGLVVGLVWGARSQRGRAGAIQGLTAGLLGPLVWLLWRIYNAIEDHYGLDSVKALLLNLALFAVIGVSIGALYGRGVQAFRRSGVQAGASVPPEAFSADELKP